jgi:hypothetical protein
MERLHTYGLNWSDLTQAGATCTELPFVIVKLVRPLNYKLLEVGDDKIFFVLTAGRIGNPFGRKWPALDTGSRILL